MFSHADLLKLSQFKSIESEELDDQGRQGSPQRSSIKAAVRKRFEGQRWYLTKATLNFYCNKTVHGFCETGSGKKLFLIAFQMFFVVCKQIIIALILNQTGCMKVSHATVLCQDSEHK